MKIILQFLIEFYAFFIENYTFFNLFIIFLSQLKCRMSDFFNLVTSHSTQTQYSPTNKKN